MRRVYEYLQGPYISQSLTEVAKKNNFFTKIDKALNQRQYVRVTLLDWDENPLKELQGVLSSGTLTKDGTSSVRRTLSLQAQIDSGGYNISNLSDEFSINKKVFIELGVKNETGEYPQCPILWFPQGVFFIYQVSISSSATSSVSLSMSLRDKMGMLNGDIGGKIAATTILDKEDDWDEMTQSYVSKKVLVYDIIENAVNHLGGEPLQNIVIEDVDTRIQRVMKWTGTNPLYLCSAQTDEQEKDTSCQYQAVTEKPADGVPNTSYSNGQDCGYVYDDFTYTGDLTVNTGATVTDILDSIVSYLGNYEYFYDEFGVFHFREIKNYLNTTYQSVSGENIKSDITYSSEYTMGEASFALDRNSNLISISSQPSYTNIKNEYVVEGLRQSTVDSISYPVRYHLVIDEKPVPCERRNFAFYEDEDTGNIVAAVVRDVNGDYPEETEYENIDYDEQKPIDPKDGYIYRFDNFPVQKQGSEKTKDEVVQDPETAKGKELYQVQEPYTWENSTLDEIKTAMNAIIQSPEFIEAVDEKYQSQKDSAAGKIDTANVVFKDSFDLYLPGSKGTSYEKYYIPRVFKDTEARGTREITNEDGTTTKKELMYPYTTASTSDCSVWLQNPLQFFLSQESMGYEVIEKEGSYEIEFYQLKGNEKVELTDYKPAVFKLIDKISEGETKNITRVGSEKLTSLSDYVGNVFCGVEGLSYTSFNDLKDAVSAITPVFEKTPALSLTNKDTIISNADKAKNILSKAVSSASVDSIGKSGASEAIERKASYASFCGCENTMTQDISNLENKVKELLLDGKVSNSETVLSYSLSYTYSLKPVTEKMLNILASYNGSTGEYDVLENAEFRASFTPKDWRSHLYFDGIVSEVNGLDENPYFEELYAYWPTIYNILPRDKSKKDSEDVEGFKDIEGNYFLDFIDASTTAIGEYNVNAIGRRADIVSDTNINCLFDLEVPEVCFIDSTSDNRQEEIQECVNNQEPWTIVPNEIYDSLATGGYRNSAYDQIKYELYLHTNYQRTLSITAIPAFYLEPNTRVEISDATTNTYGDFLIKSITYTLGQSPNMTISAAEVFERSAF